MYSIKQNVNELLHKDVNRREFLMHLGAAAVAVVGINELIRKLTEPRKTVHIREVRHGYGMSAYGR